MNKEYKILAAVDTQHIMSLLSKGEASPSDFIVMKRKGLITVSGNGMYVLTELGRDTMRKYIQGK